MHRPLVFIVMVCVAVGCSCPKPDVQRLEGAAVIVTPSALDFGGVFIGSSGSLALELRNPSGVGRTVAVNAVAPFSATATVAVAAGESVTLDVRAEPSAPGLVTATLDVDGTLVSLRVEGLEVPRCVAPDACSSTSFDLGSRQCVNQPSPDGTACATACLRAGLCERGVCRGSTIDCDDGDACTIDACNATEGCQHAPITCPAPSACQTARCDATLGCQAEPVTDGVRCGPDDCARNETRVCIEGACVTRRRPQGQLCFETLAGLAAGPGLVDGQGDQARFSRIVAGATDAFGTTWLVSPDAIRRVTVGGVATTTLRTNQNLLPNLATTDVWGNLYFDSGRCVTKVTPLGVMTTTAGNCSTLGINPLEGLAVERDGRIVVAWEGGLYVVPPSGTWVRLHDGRAPIAETASGSLLFVEPTPSGAFVTALERDGGTQRVRPFRGQVGIAANATVSSSLSPTGAALLVVEDAGCHLTFEDKAGANVASLHLPGSCLSEHFAFTRTSGWFGRNSEPYLVERGQGLSRGSDGGFVRFCGVVERPGDADGRGADASLRINGGNTLFGFRRDLMVLNDGKPVIVDSVVDFGSRVREWSDDAGLRTLLASDGGRDAMRVIDVQALDAGFWVLMSRGTPPGWSGWATPPFPGPIEQLDARVMSPLAASFEPGVGSWLFGGSIDRLDANHRLLGRVAGLQALRDGPLATPLPDAGLALPSASTADFDAIVAVTPLADGRIALIDTNALRLFADGGLTTIAGTRQTGFVDGAGSVARFDHPGAVAQGPNGVLYVADTNNRAIRSVTLQGDVRTVAILNDQPGSVAVAANGDVYVLVRHALLRGR